MIGGPGWVMYAQRQAHPLVESREWFHFGDRQWVEMCFGGDVQAVRLVEDPAGLYWGWLETGAAGLAMVQPHLGMFRMQFAYGVRAEIEAGRGRAVRLSATAAEVAATRTGDDAVA